MGLLILINSIYYVLTFVNGIIGCQSHKNVNKARLFYVLSKSLILLIIAVYSISIMFVGILIVDY